jgi:hypothetical protein
MSWDVNLNEALKIIEIVYRGHITARDLQDSTSRAIALEKEKGVILFLIDATETEIAASLMDILSLPDRQYVEEKADPLGRVAVILPRSPRAQEAARFYEMASKNRGWTVEVFPTRDRALHWLVGDPHS